MTINQRLRKRGWKYHREKHVRFWVAPRHIGKVTWIAKIGGDFWLIAEGVSVEGQSLIDLAQRAAYEAKRERKARK